MAAVAPHRHRARRRPTWSLLVVVAVLVGLPSPVGRVPTGAALLRPARRRSYSLTIWLALPQPPPDETRRPPGSARGAGGLTRSG